MDKQGYELVTADGAWGCGAGGDAELIGAAQVGAVPFAGHPRSWAVEGLVVSFVAADITATGSSTPTAPEIAALESATADESPADRLKNAMPELFNQLLEAGEAHAEAVAGTLAHLVKSTARFLDFVARFQPGPPDHRPAAYAQVDWSKLRMHLGLTYGYQSTGLHPGHPFLDPMCFAPPPQNAGSCPDERSSFISQAPPVLCGRPKTCLCTCTPSRTSPAAHCRTGGARRPRPEPGISSPGHCSPHS